MSDVLETGGGIGKVRALTIVRVEVILEMNKQGEKPADWVDLQSLIGGEEEDISDYEDVTGAIELPMEKRRKRRKKRRRGGSGNGEHNAGHSKGKSEDKKPSSRRPSKPTAKVTSDNTTAGEGAKGEQKKPNRNSRSRGRNRNNRKRPNNKTNTDKKE